jgi:hypothetical protein
VKDLRCLIECDQTSDFERWLLEGAANEQPVLKAVARMRASLGLSLLSVSRVVSTSSWKVAMLAVSVGILMGLRGRERLATDHSLPSASATTSQRFEAVSATELEQAPASRRRNQALERNSLQSRRRQIGSKRRQMSESTHSGSAARRSHVKTLPRPMSRPTQFLGSLMTQ